MDRQPCGPESRHGKLLQRVCQARFSGEGKEVVNVLSVGRLARKGRDPLTVDHGPFRTQVLVVTHDLLVDLLAELECMRPSHRQHRHSRPDHLGGLDRLSAYVRQSKMSSLHAPQSEISTQFRGQGHVVERVRYVCIGYVEALMWLEL